MTRTFKALAALLSYPSQDICDASDALRRALSEDGLVPAHQRGDLGTLIDELGTRDLYDLQARYVDLFDRSRSLSLHLFEHIHGESRDRGQAMVDLKALYQSHGLEPAAGAPPNEG